VLGTHLDLKGKKVKVPGTDPTGYAVTDRLRLRRDRLRSRPTVEMEDWLARA